MNRYDIVFMGHLGTGKIVPFQGSHFVERGGPAFFGPIAAASLKKRIATVTRIAEYETELLEALKVANVDLYVKPVETVQYRVVFPTPNVDERQVFRLKGGGNFSVDDVPPVEPCLIHLGGLSFNEFSVEFMESLKARGFRLSVDMCSFVNQVDNQTGLVYLEDVPEKREILRMVDFAKLDVMEAKALTGSTVPKDQADILEGWGSCETIITSSECVLARKEGKAIFAKFTNRSVKGRMGRGDTVMGSYLARRLDHSVEDSLRFAAALTSIKMEAAGPFTGSIEDVMERMGERPH